MTKINLELPSEILEVRYEVPFRTVSLSRKNPYEGMEDNSVSFRFQIIGGVLIADGYDFGQRVISVKNLGK